MQGNDISVFATTRQGTMFEGVLATQPIKSPKYFTRKTLSSDTEESWEKRLSLWLPSTMPLKSLADQVNRMGIMTDVYTFLSPYAVDPISKWLIRKGISAPVFYYENVAELAYDLSFNRSVRRVFTASQEDAQVLGMRATVVSSDRAWS